MVQVVIPKETVGTIMGLTEPYDLCDEYGTVWGRVTPNSTSVGDKFTYDDLVIPYSKEEIEAAMKEPEISTQRLLQRIRELESQQ